jgi:hypothetical protein
MLHNLQKKYMFLLTTVGISSQSVPFGIVVQELKSLLLQKMDSQVLPLPN